MKKRSPKKQMEPHLGPAIARLLARQEIRQSQICQEIGMTPAQVSNFLRGQKDINASNLVLMLKFLGIDLAKLIRNEAGMKTTLSENVESQLTVLGDCERDTLSSFLMAFQERYQKDMKATRQKAEVHA